MEERITNRDWAKAEIQDDKKSVSWGYRHIRLKKLWGLENGLEDGTILKFPCPLNSKAYIRMGDDSIKEVTIVEYNIEPNGIFAKAMWYDGHCIHMYVNINEIYVSKEEAKEFYSTLEDKN